MLPYNKKLKPISQKLRRETTETEQILWSRIRKKQILNTQFYRQKTIGNFIVDFYCPKYKLVIEIDGGQHFETKNLQKDQERDAYFCSLELTVLRFTNLDIFHHLEGVLDEIFETIQKSRLFGKEELGKI